VLIAKCCFFSMCENNAMPPDGPHIPEFIYGTAWKEEHTAALTEQAIRAGFRAIDTANQRKHYYEGGVGEGLAAVYEAGIVKREDLFLQTKFTYQRGQDHRLPFDPKAPIEVQVEQSLTSSLDHLGGGYVDSLVLHGPSTGYEWSADDQAAWQAMLKERDRGRTRMVGVSNVSLLHLQQMIAIHGEPPAFVQNRCYARLGWDREVRAFCREHNIIYQGFSLLTANMETVRHSVIARIAFAENASPAQVVFAFVRALGILPLTGTSSEEHMKQDLASRDLSLSEEAVRMIESLGG
jgi:diketogulonate reductase-like aldo/keto reductase